MIHAPYHDTCIMISYQSRSSKVSEVSQNQMWSGSKHAWETRLLIYLIEEERIEMQHVIEFSFRSANIVDAANIVDRSQIVCGCDRHSVYLQWLLVSGPKAAHPSATLGFTFRAASSFCFYVTVPQFLPLW